MHLQIRDPRARELARKIPQQPLATRLGAIADELAAISKPGGRDMTKDEIGSMWGHDIALLYKGNDFAHTDLG